eukprot:CAMPEP_0179712448 /NCGR_PEP_ID=MMETSP0937-20121108/7511_1 /TAXON_ID=548131 ORGANISM="Ostreococcus mediterraneus, Strain clade-D-RCC2593" /NCGR_SAMPLE_ID=MMETSP0937 /ASSEMBLY_ACC=CAM_ASM_000575 /LENGTH=61 /DNA_ID=CAMNT_0021586039 /DNA_START=203 /DNA_END=384 /DNA_ORIENTATION=-
MHEHSPLYSALLGLIDEQFMTVNGLSEVVLRLYVSEVNVKRYSAPRSPTSLRLSNLTAPDT